MPQTAVLFGALLFALGPIFYFLGEPGARSPTAFIPALIGIFIAAFGLAARNPARLKAAMHGAAAFGVIGVLGSLMGAKNWPKILTGQPVPRPLASWEQLLMFVLCALFVVMCVQSFRAARRSAR